MTSFLAPLQPLRLFSDRAQKAVAHVLHQAVRAAWAGRVFARTQVHACAAGQGALKRSVLQVWSKQGDLLAEHDRIHSDPVYAALFLRGQVDAQWLEVFAPAAAETVAQAVAHD